MILALLAVVLDVAHDVEQARQRREISPIQFGVAADLTGLGADTGIQVLKPRGGIGDIRLRQNVVSPRMVTSTGSVTVTKGLMDVSVPSRNVTNRAAPSVSSARLSVMSWET
jgi:hypothetical protein